MRVPVLRRVGLATPWGGVSMEDKLMDILKDRIDERVSEAVSDASVNHITAVMSELGCTPERAMDLLHIPESERPTYVGLMEERKQ